jgi:hypothetical protein
MTLYQYEVGERTGFKNQICAVANEMVVLGACISRVFKRLYQNMTVFVANQEVRGIQVNRPARGNPGTKQSARAKPDYEASADAGWPQIRIWLRLGASGVKYHI